MTNLKKSQIQQVVDGIYVIETNYLNRQRFAACYLLACGGEAAVIETNTNNAVPNILEAVKQAGLTNEQVKYVILTHIHLDHAGGTGELMRHLPNAQLVLHGRGKRHMIDPTKLIESVKQVYGEEKYREYYGEIQPVEKARVTVAEDKQVITVGGRELLLLDAPGHAKHHIVIFEKETRSLFSGDAFGIAYPRFFPDGSRLVFPSTSPTQFDPGAALETYQKIVDLEPERILHTHFGSNELVQESHEQLKEWVGFSKDLAHNGWEQGLREKELYEFIRDRIWARFEEAMVKARAESLSEEEREFLFLDADLNAQGLAFYIQKLHS